MAFETDRDKVKHLLRRFGLGASEAEVDFYAKDDLPTVVDKLLNYEAVDEGFPFGIADFMQGDPPRLQMNGVSLWWHLRLIMTKRPLQEKMTLFWHDHFATSAAKVNVPPLMFQQNETLRANATGKFQTLLLEMSKDPAMLFWLDNQFNVRGKANENFAREIMELFTLGIGHYSEKDVQEAARAFTGWAFVRGRQREDTPVPVAEYVFRPRQHDTGTKEILGSKGEFRGEDVIGLLCGHPQTALNITTKIWEWFAYPGPEKGLIERLSQKFVASGLDVKTLLREVMLAPEFYSKKALRVVYKNPADFVVSTLRQLGVGEALRDDQDRNARLPVLRRVAPAAAAAQTMRSMGMQLLFPPDVAGWEGGASWVSSATMVERIQWADRLFGTNAASRGRAQLRLPAFNLLSQSRSPEQTVTKLTSIFDADLPSNKLKDLTAAAEKASGGSITRQNANETAAAVTRLIFGSPEFQFT